MKRISLVLLAIGITACANVDGGGEVSIDAPNEATFTPVADFLVKRCGTLDCHGQSGRNLRLYGQYGLRLSKMDNAGDEGAGTTMDEYTSDYRSVVGLEPEKITAVEKGKAKPTDLLLLAKPMGIETHKGLTLIAKGDDQYECIVLWLQGQDPSMACGSAMNLP